ncbi:MAG: secondary thiamine-phosphate synthase enzyme YjbQ [Patulibacter sp.]
MTWVQRTVRLAPRPRGLHLITGEVLDALPELETVAVGLLHVFCRHTSAALTLNENASPDVPADLRRWLDRAVPEDAAWTHVDEGPDDMPAHVKTALLGPDLTIPVTDGALALGTWQGIMLAEHRDRGGPRSLVLTLSGQGD